MPESVVGRRRRCAWWVSLRGRLLSYNDWLSGAGRGLCLLWRLLGGGGGSGGRGIEVVEGVKWRVLLGGLMALGCCCG